MTRTNWLRSLRTRLLLSARAGRNRKSERNPGNRWQERLTLSRPEFLEDRCLLTATNPLLLAGLDGLTGTVFTDPGGSSFGSNVGSAGDFNGDQYADFIIGNGSSAFVVFGQPGGLSSSFDVGTLDGTNGFEITDVSSSILRNVGAADVNGDGLSDVFIGDSSNDRIGIIYGQTPAFVPTISLNALNGTNGSLLTAPGSGIGQTVASAGDIDTDGFEDLIVGVRSDPILGSNSSSAAIIYGLPGGFGAGFNLSTLDGSNGYFLTDDVFFTDEVAVSGAGDFNGDGSDDVIVSFGASENIVIHYGSDNRPATSHLLVDDIGILEGRRLRPLPENTNSLFLHAVAGGGDVNGDGLNDVVIGEYQASQGAGGQDSGSTYLVFGERFPAAVDVNFGDLDGTNGFRIDGAAMHDRSGRSVDLIGDVNGDGMDDIGIGAPGQPYNGGSARPGQVFVVFGTGSPSPIFNLTDIDGDNGFRVDGATDVDQVGISVSRGGDINGDGFADLIVGDGGPGNAFVVHGGNFTGSVTHLGDATANILNGTVGNDVMIGGDGDDMLNGMGGLDVLRGGPGNDELRAQYVPGVQLEGGPGNDDTFRISGSGFTVELTPPFSSYLVRDIERIDLTGEGANSVVVTFRDIIRISDTNTLTVFGTGDDIVHHGTGWTAAGTVMIDGLTFDVFTQGAATLRIQQNVQATEQEAPNLITITSDSVTEDDAAGTTIGTLGAQDANTGETFMFSVVDDFNGLVRLNPDGVTVELNGQPDFEITPQLLPVFRVTDSAGFTFDQQVPINVIDTLTDNQINVDNVGGNTGARITSDQMGDRFGASISTQDVDGDGNDDFLIGAPNTSGGGAAYLWFGNAGIIADLNVSAVDGTNGFVFLGGALDDGVGISVVITDDINGGGIPDLLIGGGGNNPDLAGSNHGRSYAIFGDGTNLANFDVADGTADGQINLDQITQAFGYVIKGSQDGGSALFGTPNVSVAAPGDVSGDSVPDIVINEVNFDDGSTDGERLSVIHGGAANWSSFDLADGFEDGQVTLGNLDGTTGFQVLGIAQGDRIGRELTGAGDFDGDGVNDLLVGARDALTFSGEIYAVRGGAGLPLLDSLDGNADGTARMANLNGPPTGFRIQTPTSFNSLGIRIGAGDLDGDGIDDLSMTAYGATSNGDSFILFGSELPNLDDPDVGSRDGIIVLPETPPSPVGTPDGSEQIIFLRGGPGQVIHDTTIIPGAPGTFGQLLVNICEFENERVILDLFDQNALTGTGPVITADLSAPLRRYVSTDAVGSSEELRAYLLGEALVVGNPGDGVISIVFGPPEAVDDLGISVNVVPARFKVEGTTATYEQFRYEATFTVTNNGDVAKTGDVELQFTPENSFVLAATFNGMMDTSSNSVAFNTTLSGPLAPGESEIFVVEVITKDSIVALGLLSNNDPDDDAVNDASLQIVSAAQPLPLEIVLDGVGDMTVVHDDPTPLFVDFPIDTSVLLLDLTGGGVTSLSTDASARSTGTTQTVSDDATFDDGVSRLDVDAFLVQFAELPSLSLIGSDQGNDTLQVVGLDSAAVAATIRIFGLDGADTCDGSGSPFGVTCDGGAGNDSITGSALADILFGGDGDDNVTGGPGNDNIDGENGDDVIIWNNGDGSDAIDGGNGTDKVEVNGADNAAEGDQLTVSESDGALNITRTAGAVLEAFTLINTAVENAEFNTNAGADSLVVSALGGLITPLTGFEGDLGDGDDFIDCTDCTVGVDFMLGLGNDTAIGSAFNDVFDCGAGDDSCTAGAGDDFLTCGDGDDFCDGGAGLDTLFGGFGADTLIGGLDDDFLTCGDGDDFCDGGAGLDILFGGFGADTLIGGSGPDVISGDDDDDTLVIDPDDAGSTVDGGAGTNTVDIGTITEGQVTTTFVAGGILIGIGANPPVFTSSVTVAGMCTAVVQDHVFNLTNANDTADLTDVFVNNDKCSQLVGSFGQIIFRDDQTVTINSLAGDDLVRLLTPDTLFGAFVTVNGDVGNDTLDASAFPVAGVEENGGDGTDSVIGSVFADTVRGDAGNDTLVGGGEADNIEGGTGDDMAMGGGGDDFILGEAGADTLDGEAGDDGLTGGMGDDLLRGGAGNDNVIGSDDVDTLEGGDGNDFLAGGEGDDSLKGDAGDDVLNGQNGSDTVEGGADNDTIDGGNEDDSLLGDAGNDSITGFNGIDTLKGGVGDDTLEGEEGDDEIEGEDGDDSILGGAGDDFVLGGEGKDTIEGEDGDDVLNGQNGDDTIEGGNNNDIIDGGNDDDSLLGDAGNDVITGFAGDDTLEGGLGNDDLQGEADDDTLRGDDGVDVLKGGAGNDSLEGGLGNDDLQGEADDDTLKGDDGVDVLKGGAGNDSLEGGLGADDLQGEADDDTLKGDDGVDVLNGGPGDDDLDGGAGDDNPLDGGPGNDTVRGGDGDDNIVDALLEGNDSLLGGPGDDTINAMDGNNFVSGGDGIDALNAGPGDDTITGGDENDTINDTGGANLIDGDAGNDVITAAAGNDTISGDTGADTIADTGGNNEVFGNEGIDVITTAAGDDTVSGGSENDTINDAGGANILNGNAGIDVINAGAGDDVISGGPDDDTITDTGGFNQINGDDGDDTISGGANRDIISGDGGNDDINGGNGNDLINGGTGSDSITGQGGNDFLIGGSVNDTLFGEAGSDTVSGGLGNDQLDGGSGTDLLVESFDSNFTLTDSMLTGPDAGGVPVFIDQLSSIETANLTGGATGNVLDASAFTLGSTSLAGVGGDDTLIGSDQDDTLTGGGGDDSLSANAGNDSLFGGFNPADPPPADPIPSDGNNTFDGGSGNDTVTSGDGDDTFIETPGSDDVISDSGGADTIDFSSAASAITFSLAENSGTPQIVDAGLNTVAVTGTIEGLVGTPFNDQLVGSDADDTISGLGGDDSLTGDDGNDILRGGSGKDELIGNAGNDNLNGGGSTGDTLEGGDGDDTLNGGSGNDIIRETSDADIVLTNTTMTGRGNDTVISAERARIFGGASAQTLDLGGFSTPGLTSVTVDGAGGDDSIVATDGNDILRGSGGNDTVEAGDGNDRVFGGGGSDLLNGEDGNDVLKGLGASGDKLIGGPGDDVLNGGRGVDRLIETGDVDFVLTVTSLTGMGTDVVQAIEIGELNGGASGNTIDVSAFLGGPKGFIVVRGNGGDDTVTGSAGPDLLNGGDGDDILLGKVGADTLNGDAGADGLSGHEGDDLINGGDFHDIAYGGNGNDTINGERGVDRLIGGAGDDVIDSGNGADTVVGGTGNDDASVGDMFNDLAEVDELFTIDPLPGWVDQV